MASYTSNLNLKKPALTDDALVTDLNDNSDKLDAAISAGSGAIAIVSVGNTHAAISSGQYVYVRQHGSLSEGLYKATTNIAANGTLSGSNLTAVSGGGLNSLSDQIGTLNGKFKKRFTVSSESALATACSNLAIGEFAVGEIADSVLTLGATVPVIIYKRAENVYFADIIYSGYQGYYYSDIWHWHKFSYT